MIRTQIARRLAVVAGAVLLSSVTAVPALAAQYTVQPGETLSGIASNYNLPVSVLAQQNDISNVNLIYAGQQLSIPNPPPAPPIPYTIGFGDTLTGIADAHGVTVADLLSINNGINDPNVIYVGQVIDVPGGVGGGITSVATTSGAPAISQAQVKQLIDADAASYGLDPLLVEALAWQESGWQQQVVSSAGAVGVMQILPATGTWISQYVLGEPLDVTNSAADNILAGTVYLKWLVNRTATTKGALAGYYQGLSSVQSSGVQAGTQQYIDAVLAIRNYIAQHGVPPQS